MKINTEKFIAWLKEEVEYSNEGIKKYIHNADFAQALETSKEKEVYEALLEMIEDPEFFETEWIDKD